MKTILSRLLLLLALAFTVVPVSSCVPLVAGAAVGYVAHEEGVRVRNPITREDND